MLRAGINDPDHPLILVGLTAENVARLKAGYPIRAEFSTFGVKVIPGTLAIVYGETHGDLEAMMRKSGLCNPDVPAFKDGRLEEEAAIRKAHKYILLCTVGLPRSGKTTWAQSQAHPIVNPDSIRLALHGNRFIARAEPFVWATAKAMVLALFLAGHKTVILDATNTTRKRRDEWKSEEWGTFFKEIPTTKEECLARAVNDVEIIPVINRMAEQYEPLQEGERKWP
jgi:predicted kinase